MSTSDEPSAEDMIRYHKDPKSKIATITLDRPEHLNAPTSDARLRYADLLYRANVDDDVKVLVVRGVGDSLGSGADVPDVMDILGAEDDGPRLREVRLDPDEDVRYPPKGSYRASSLRTQLYANAHGGCRSLQEFKKISIVEAKGYCYGWHFYQAGDADLVIASEDTLFGHPAFRYAGWGPRMWTWAETMGLRKFQEMVFTGRPFTAQEMADCNFVNKVVPRDRLEAETEKFALACSRSRPTDTVAIQKTLFEIYKQYRGEYMGSMLTGIVESLGRQVRPDRDELEVTAEMVERGFAGSVKDNDRQYPPDFRLSRSAREQSE